MRYSIGAESTESHKNTLIEIFIYIYIYICLITESKEGEWLCDWKFLDFGESCLWQAYCKTADTLSEKTLCENSILLCLNSFLLDTVQLQELSGFLFNSKCWCWGFNILLWCKWLYSNHYWYHQLPSETDARKWISWIKIVECWNAR